MPSRPTAIAGVLVIATIAGALGIGALGRSGVAPPCGTGFTRRGTRCEVAKGSCPPSFARDDRDACHPPDLRVLIRAAAMTIGPSDWEAEGRGSRFIRVAPFRIDAFEIARGAWQPHAEDPFRAASGMTREEAASFCAARGGRLPSEDEWIVAALSGAPVPHRYPWGDTGAVCRRAAWGLEWGPCGKGATGPDTVGAHDDGDTTLGLHDLAGNVAEWVSPDTDNSDVEIAKGGSWRTMLATDLRIWARLEFPRGARSNEVGARCAYPP